MASYIVRRVLISCVVLWGITIIAFFIVTLAPGDAVDLLVDPGLTKEEIEFRRELLGLDQPAHIQYARWLNELVKGNMGYSFSNNQPVLDKILLRITATLRLAIATIIVSHLIAIPIGVLSAIKPYSLWDNFATFFCYLGVSTPAFFFGLILIYVFSLKLGWLPTGGMHTIGIESSIVDQLKHLILPVTVLSLSNASLIMRYTRSSMLEVTKRDFMVTARGKGLSEKKILFRHGLRNSLIPLITLLGIQIPTLLGGSIITEQVFGWPGMGRLAIDAIYQRDYPVIMGINLITAVLVLTGNFFSDMLYGIADPRIRLGGSKSE